MPDSQTSSAPENTVFEWVTESDTSRHHKRAIKFPWFAIYFYFLPGLQLPGRAEPASVSFVCIRFVFLPVSHLIPSGMYALVGKKKKKKTPYVHLKQHG